MKFKVRGILLVSVLALFFPLAELFALYTKLPDALQTPLFIISAFIGFVGVVGVKISAISTDKTKGAEKLNNVGDHIAKLYETLRDGKLNQARMLYVHLTNIHKLAASEIRNKLETLCHEKVVTASLKQAKKGIMK